MDKKTQKNTTEKTREVDCDTETLEMVDFAN
jgi:hypothetical protein